MSLLLKKKFEDWLAFGKVTGKNIEVSFFSGHSVDGTQRTVYDTALSVFPTEMNSSNCNSQKAQCK